MRVALLLMAGIVAAPAMERCAMTVDVDGDGKLEQVRVEGGGVEGRLVVRGAGRGGGAGGGGGRARRSGWWTGMW